MPKRSSYTDFEQLENFNDYVSARHHITGTVALGDDAARIVANAEYSFTVKELVCGLMSGNGLKMPNLQVGLHSQLSSLLLEELVANMQQPVYDAINQVRNSVEDFMDHTKLDDVLGRMNVILAEAQQIASLINFCAAPADPKAIPAMIEESFGSFLGPGKSLMDTVGKVPESRVCSLVSGAFDPSAFVDGFLKDVADWLQDIIAGTLSIPRVESLVAQAKAISEAVASLINKENTVLSTYDQGGSQFSTPDPGCNPGVGVLHNSRTGGINANARLASTMKALYDNLGGYPVRYRVPGAGPGENEYIEYPNIFHLLVEPDLLELLQKEDEPLPTSSTEVPILDYCGNVVGYREVYDQRDAQDSDGSTPTIPNSPGYNAGGFITSIDNTTSTSDVVSQTTVIQNFSGSGNNLYIVSDESSMLALQTNTNDIVVRTDILTTFIRKNTADTDTGTLADYQPGNQQLFDFLNNLNVEQGDGVIVKDAGVSRARAVEGTSGQTRVVNGDGRGGNIRVELEENTRIPGTAALKLPVGTTAQRPNTEVGEIRYNIDTHRLEAYYGDTSTWRQVATTDDIVSQQVQNTNIGFGAAVFKLKNAANQQEFRRINNTGLVTVSQNDDDITIGDQLTVTNIGNGTGIFSDRQNNTLRFKSLTSNGGITLTDNGDSINISGGDVYDTILTTTDNSPVQVLFDGVSIQPESGKTWFYRIEALAAGATSTDRQAFKIEGVVQNNGGNISLVGTPNRTDYQRSTFDTYSDEWDVNETYNAGSIVEYDLNLYQVDVGQTVNPQEDPPDINSKWIIYYDGWNTTSSVVGTPASFQIRVKGQTDRTINWRVRLSFISV
jgi:hypothetical protein